MSQDNGIGTVWGPRSGTGQAQAIGGGFGLGGFGEGGFGEGTDVVISTVLSTDWTPFGENETDWTPLSGTGLEEIVGGGYGLGPYGAGPYGGGSVTIIHVDLNTEWTVFNER